VEVVRSGREWYEVVSEGGAVSLSAVCLVYLIYLAGLSDLSGWSIWDRGCIPVWECMGWRVLRVLSSGRVEYRVCSSLRGVSVC